MARKKKNGIYWTEETEQAVRDYQNAESDIDKNRIFARKLYVPLTKICEVYSNIIDIGYVDEDKSDMVVDCLTHLVTAAIPKFNPSMNTKAYSYFSVSAKYWFMQKNMKAYKRTKRDEPFLALDTVNDSADERYVIDSNNIYTTERYYKFLNWFKSQLETLYYPGVIKQHIYWMLEFMSDFDEVNDWLKLRVMEKFRARYPKSRGSSERFARACIYEQYLYFCAEYDKEIFNPTPLPTKKGNKFNSPMLRELSPPNPNRKKEYQRYYKKKKLSN